MQDYVGLYYVLQSVHVIGTAVNERSLMRCIQGYKLPYFWQHGVRTFGSLRISVILICIGYIYPAKIVLFSASYHSLSNLIFVVLVCLQSQCWEF